MEKFLRTADEVLLEIEMAFGKAETVCDDLDQEYFAINAAEENSEKMMAYFFEPARMRSMVVSDYLVQLGKAICEMRTLIDKQSEKEGK